MKANPMWMTLPEAISEEYKNNSTLLELAVRYKAPVAQVRQRLINLGIAIRPKGLNPNRPNQVKKLHANDIIAILKMDDEDVPHAHIGKRFNVSRERIRQICLESGKATRRSRMTKSLRYREVKEARKQERLTNVNLVSEAWKRGDKIDELGVLIFGNEVPANKTVSKMAWLRRRYGLELFPYRKPNHHNIKKI